MRQVCLRGGALPSWVTNVTTNNFILWPNLDLVPKAIASFEETTQTVSNPVPVRTAEKNFLKDAVVLLYEYNRTRDASYWFNYLKSNFTNALQSDEVNLTAEGFAFKQIQSQVTEEDPNKAKGFILGLTMQEYLCLIADDDERAENFRRMAATVWQSYENHLPPGPKANDDRLRLDPLDKLRTYELDDLEHRLSPQAAAILRNRLGVLPGAPPAPPPNPPPTGGGSA
jgi:hypothetical protein